MKTFYKKNRLYRNNTSISDCFYDIIPKHVTLRKDINSKIFEKQVDDFHETAFHEIDVVPYNEVEFLKIGNFFDTKIQVKNIDVKTFSQIMFTALCSIIKREWDSQKFHVILHSSGYDSRLISLAIRKLYRENGSNWLGKILFVEAGGEAELFKQIMQYEGWDESQYAICFKDNCNDPTEYFSDCFDFKTAYKKTNGVLSYPINIWWDTIDWLQNKGIIPDDNSIQCWS